ncbi:MAG: transporter [Proteobacteria bacterium]|nr:transporter [Pseudomonadota bacterium]
MLAAVLLSTTAASGQSRAVDAHFFRPGLYTGAMFGVDVAQSALKWRLGTRVLADFESKPLHLRFPQADCPAGGCRRGVLDWAMISHLQAQFGLTRWLELGLDLPLMRHGIAGGASGGLGLLRASDPITNVPASRVSPLDVRLGLRARLWQSDTLALAIALQGSVPFGDEEVFAGEGKATLEPRLLATARLDGWVASLNLGYHWRPERRLVLWDNPDDAEGAVPLLGVDDELSYGASLFFFPHWRVGLGVELLGALPLSSAAYSVQTRSIIYPPATGCPAGAAAGLPCEIVTSRRAVAPGTMVSELLGGLSLRPSRSLKLVVGAGAGLTGAERRADLRVLAGLSWISASSQEYDRDHDGIPDERDQCPLQAEDVDGVSDDDGCPDFDNDGDGVGDVRDRCENEAEDIDGFRDDDGCPDLDNDGDQIPDLLDRCPDEAEDRDGVLDQDGCPDLDNDDDGVPDARDRCPDEAETKNGFQDDDGCPDLAPQL